MPVKYKLVDGRTRVARQLREMQEKLSVVPDLVAKRTVDIVIDRSPVDTGTYMESHAVGTTSATSSSAGKPTGQPRGPREEVARTKLHAQIDSSDFSSGNFYINNGSEHASLVEYELANNNGDNPHINVGEQYAPYTTARLMAPTILEDVKRELGLT